MFLHDCQRTKDINGKLPSNVSSVYNIRNAIVINYKDNITIILRYSRMNVKFCQNQGFV